jgi:hypothetical protein
MGARAVILIANVITSVGIWRRQACRPEILRVLDTRGSLVREAVRKKAGGWPPFLAAIAAALLATGCAAAAAAQERPPAAGPNFVFVPTDDQSVNTLA